MPEKKLEPHAMRSLIWGAIGAAITVTISLISHFFPVQGAWTPNNPMAEIPAKAMVVGFFLGWAASELRAWAERRPRR